MALVVGALVLAKVPEGKAASAGLDVPGAVLMAVSLLGLVWGLARGNRDGWGSTQVLVSLAAGVVVGAMFVASQRMRAWDAMVPPRLFRSPVLAAGLGAAFLMTAALMGTLFFMAQFFQVAWHLSPPSAGACMLPWTATLFLVAPVAGAVVRRVGERALAVTGLGFQAVGLAWLAVLVRADAEYWLWVAPLVMAGGGLSMAIPAVQSAVLGAVEPSDMGKASGLFNTLRQLGGVFGVALVVAVFTHVGGYASPAEFGAGFTVTLMVTAALSLAGAAVGLRLKPREVPSNTAAVQGVNS